MSLLAWLVVLLRPSRAWDLRPRDDDAGGPDPEAWPAVAVVVPARNEAGVLPGTLAALAVQDYPGALRVLVVDDRSGDATAEVARAAGAEVVTGAPLPEGWVGKVWAMEQGTRAALAATPRPAHVLLTDADVHHAPGSVTALVREAEASGASLVSRMARLRCASPAERLLVPAFVLFFLLLYPLRLANRPGRRGAAAAGGCMLLRAGALERLGGLGVIRGALIDDLALARAVKAGLGEPVRLRLSEGTVTSVREYWSVGAVWRMVARSAFEQLRRSWALVLATAVVMAVVFAAPPVAVVAGVVAGARGACAPGDWAPALTLGVAAWAAMWAVSLPTARYFRISAAWGLLLPLAGVLYGAMTVQSAISGSSGSARGWRDRGD